MGNEQVLKFKSLSAGTNGLQRFLMGDARLFHTTHDSCTSTVQFKQLVAPSNKTTDDGRCKSTGRATAKAANEWGCEPSVHHFKGGLDHWSLNRKLFAKSLQNESVSHGITQCESVNTHPVAGHPAKGGALGYMERRRLGEKSRLGRGSASRFQPRWPMLDQSACQRSRQRP